MSKTLNVILLNDIYFINDIIIISSSSKSRSFNILLYTVMRLHELEIWQRKEINSLIQLCYGSKISNYKLIRLTRQSFEFF